MILSEPLLEATRDYLQDNLSNLLRPKRSVRVTTNDKAPPYAGTEFFGVFGSTANNAYVPHWISRRIDYGLSISLTRRLQGAPPDMQGEAAYTHNEEILLTAKKSMVERAHEVISLVDGNWDIINNLRQDVIDLGEDICIMTPLGFIDGDAAPEEVFQEHFHVYDEDYDNDRPVGLRLTLNFGDVRTYQEKI